MSKKHPWLDAYPQNLSWKFTPPVGVIFDLLEKMATTHPQRPCINFLGKRYTYGETLTTALKVATGLQALGVKKGDRVGICLPNTPYYLFAYYGALRAGATVVNFNPLYTADELAAQIRDSGVTHLFTLNLKPLAGKLEQARRGTRLAHLILCPLEGVLPPLKALAFNLFKFYLKAPAKGEGVTTFAHLTAQGEPPAEVKINPGEDTALFQYTGGTSGLPKGAMLNHANVVANTEQVRLWLGETSPEGERFLAVLPFFHVFAMTAIQNLALATGSEIVMLPRFDIKQLLQTIHKTRPTLFPAVPTLFSAINNYEEVGRYDLSSIRFCISGGAPLPVEVKNRFEITTGARVVEGYGLSETSPVLTCNPPGSGGISGSAGLPLPGTEICIRSVDNPSQEMPVGKPGEVCARGPQVMEGYWNRPEENKTAFTPDGWLRTGDIGYLDEAGYLFLTDRLKDLILCSGYNVYPRVIEEALHKHPEVAEVTVIGTPHPQKGEAPKAFVVLKEGAIATEDELLDFAVEHLNPIERPIALELRNELPKTLVGKLSKKELKEEEKQKAQES